MLVRMDINTLKSGRVQIAIFRADQSNGSVQTYPAVAEAKSVLLAVGVSEPAIEQRLEILSEVGPNEVLHFGQLEVPDDVLEAHGFRP